MRAIVVVRDSRSELWSALLEAWRETALAAVSARGRFTVALSGGRTPEDFYRALGQEPGLPWRRTHIFLVDERIVAPTHPESNARLVRESLLAGLTETPAGVHFPLTDVADPATSAADYERQLRAVIAGSGAPAPDFDLVLLGLGADGHTASLFPGSDALRERSRLVVAVPAAEGRLARVTLTLPAIAGARRVIVLATGAAKREALARVLGGDRGLPAALVAPAAGAAEFFVDREACPA